VSIRLRMEPWGRSHGGYSPSTFARGESALRVHLLPALGAEGSDRWTLVMSVASYRLVREEGNSNRSPDPWNNVGVLNYAVETDLISRSPPCRASGSLRSSPRQRL